MFLWICVSVPFTLGTLVSQAGWTEANDDKRKNLLLELEKARAAANRPDIRSDRDRSGRRLSL